MEVVPEKYKFFHNGHAWWLRVEDFKTLLRWFGDSRSMWSAAFNDAIDVEVNKRHSSNPLGAALNTYARMLGISLLQALDKLTEEAATVKLDLLEENGFLNINCDGGCNSIDWPMLQVEYRDKLVFPHYSEEDIRIKTFKPTDFKEGYNYHYYAYIGNLQVTDGDVTKWDTKAEAYEVAKRFVEMK